ncbi:MAG: hypothetical protein FRX48_05967 [Lasallia pustulata]|uniref:Uncharacterized protein n=1 Tax=Lasallia pustulata TaxID=136370 RepID=A0A5M8PM27_9LECA|nr:MAG: hypothetical protein FRX48_05967 [Lasallia pustulata]
MHPPSQWETARHLRIYSKRYMSNARQTSLKNGAGMYMQRVGWFLGHFTPTAVHAMILNESACGRDQTNLKISRSKFKQAIT